MTVIFGFAALIVSPFRISPCRLNRLSLASAPACACTYAHGGPAGGDGHEVREQSL
jgi:hypothetical protein